MARVEGIEQGSRLDAADFSKNDPVRSPAESGLQKVVKSYLGLERIGLAFRRQNVWLLDLKFGGVLDDNEAILFGNRVGQIRSSVDLPVPVPPLISSVLPLRICPAKRSASARVSVPRAIRSSTV